MGYEEPRDLGFNGKLADFNCLGSDDGAPAFGNRFAAI
jgi:hypothetical protein